MSIVIGADIVPTSSNQMCFQSGDICTLLGDDLIKVLKEADYRIVNLETPLCDTMSPIAKIGLNLCAPTKCINSIKAMGVNLAGIANNHIMDQGGQGLASTIETLAGAGIAYVGAGNNISEAQKPVLFYVKGKKVSVYACAEHEFSIAGDDVPGANPVDLLNLTDYIIQCKALCDYLIVLYHGGKEYYPYPSPNLQKVCRKIVEKGADLVICQHSHCLGSYENYLTGHIVYGQGNFIFDDGEDECLQTSVLVKISDDWTIDYIPIRKTGSGVRLAVGAERENILKGFQKRSQQILEVDFVKQEYAQFANKYRQFYLTKLHGRTMKNKCFRLLNRLFLRKLVPIIISRSYSDKEALEIQNYIECESHRELLIAGIKHNKNREV